MIRTEQILAAMVVGAPGLADGPHLEITQAKRGLAGWLGAVEHIRIPISFEFTNEHPGCYTVELTLLKEFTVLSFARRQIVALHNDLTPKTQ